MLLRVRIVVASLRLGLSVLLLAQACLNQAQFGHYWLLAVLSLLFFLFNLLLILEWGITYELSWGLQAQIRASAMTSFALFNLLQMLNEPCGFLLHQEQRVNEKD